MLARRETERVIELARAPQDDSWYEYKNPNIVVPDEGYLQRSLGALYRNRRLALAVLAGVVVLAAVYLLVATPIYEAYARVLIDPDTPNVITFKDVIQGDESKLEYYQTQLEILRSRTLARRTLDTLDMWRDPEITATGMLSRTIRMARTAPSTVIYGFSRMLGNRADATEPPPAIGETAAQSRAIDEFLKRLVLNYRADNRILEVGYRSANARHAAEVSNAIARK